MRLDELLLDRRLVDSRAKARALILAGRVFVGESRQTKAGARIDAGLPLRLEKPPRYVSRGGDKLEAALKDLHVDVRGRTALDVGASTGGFTDCLLQHGAAEVYAIDVGRGQIDARFRLDPRVIIMEKTHILKLDPSLIKDPADLACVDVSFISLRKVLPAVAALLVPGGEILALFKPQFEVGPRHLKKGIVKDEAVSREAREEFGRWASSAGFTLAGWAPSALKGMKGNQEHFVRLKHRGHSAHG